MHKKMKPHPICERLRNLRKSKGLAQEDVAKSLSRVCEEGVSRAAVGQWESGVTVPSLEMIQALGEVLDVDPGDLAFGSKSPKDIALH
jgi:transcriptional regulator with XRE-family HTH domain